MIYMARRNAADRRKLCRLAFIVLDDIFRFTKGRRDQYHSSRTRILPQLVSLAVFRSINDRFDRHNVNQIEKSTKACCYSRTKENLTSDYSRRLIELSQSPSRMTSNIGASCAGGPSLLTQMTVLAVCALAARENSVTKRFMPGTFKVVPTTKTASIGFCKSASTVSPITSSSGLVSPYNTIRGLSLPIPRGLLPSLILRISLSSQREQSGTLTSSKSSGVKESSRRHFWHTIVWRRPWSWMVLGLCSLDDTRPILGVKWGRWSSMQSMFWV